MTASQTTTAPRDFTPEQAALRHHLSRVWWRLFHALPRISLFPGDEQIGPGVYLTRLEPDGAKVRSGVAQLSTGEYVVFSWIGEDAAIAAGPFDAAEQAIAALAGNAATMIAFGILTQDADPPAW
jgi:hypothetical protein